MQMKQMTRNTWKGSWHVNIINGIETQQKARVTVKHCDIKA